MIVKEWYDASYVSYSIRPDAGELISPLIAAMEKTMTFRLGEKGLIEENIPIGCSLHPNFNINCQECRRVFQERGRIRPFLLLFPDEQRNDYFLKVPLGLVPYLMKRNYPLPPPLRDSMSKVLEEVERILRRVVIDPEAKSVPSTVKLKPQHIDAIQRSLRYWRCTIRGIPGAGKTWVAIGLLSSLSPTLRVCWLTHTNALLNQSASRLRLAFGEPVGIVGEGSINTSERLTVAMFQTLNKRLKQGDPTIMRFVSSVDVLIIDEFHHTAATTFFFVVQSFKKAYLRWGLSATPYREITKENYFLIGALSPWVVDIGIEPLPIKLVVYDMYGSAVVPPSTGDKTLDYQRQYDTLIVKNPVRNFLIAHEAISAPPTVILVQRILHGNLLKELIRDEARKRGKDISVGFIHGEMSSTERKVILSAYENGELDVLILSDVGKEGLSLKRIRTLINAAGQKSRVALVQRVGRGLHPKGEEVRLIEFLDAGGIPRNHSMRRIKIINEEFVIKERSIIKWRDVYYRLQRERIHYFSF